jgi:hypothetical protein
LSARFARRCWFAAFIAALICAANALAQPATCAALESGVEVEVQSLAFVKDDVGLFRTIGRRAIDALTRCPESARLWYLATRSAEVLDQRFKERSFPENGGLRTLLADARAHAPASAAIATVAARVDGGSAAARIALALDPAYPPARRALAEALAREGSIDEALALVVAHGRSASMQLSRARILLAGKRPTDALREANRALAGKADELSPAADLPRDAHEARGFALLALHRPADAKRALRAASAAGSVAARNWLAQR